MSTSNLQLNISPETLEERMERTRSLNFMETEGTLQDETYTFACSSELKKTPCIPDDVYEYLPEPTSLENLLELAALMN